RYQPPTTRLSSTLAGTASPARSSKSSKDPNLALCTSPPTPHTPRPQVSPARRPAITLPRTLLPRPSRPGHSAPLVPPGYCPPRPPITLIGSRGEKFLLRPLPPGQLAGHFAESAATWFRSSAHSRRTR